MGLYRKLILTSPLVPWRLKRFTEDWIERRLRTTSPSLYRLIHLGRFSDRLSPVTHGPHHHFFGYYEKSPWNASQTLLLAHQATFNDRAPRADDPIAVGVIHLNEENRFEPLSESYAWNWQQGTMLQWYPGRSEHIFLHNDRRNERHVGIVRDISGAEIAVFDHPIYAVLPDGDAAFSVNFSRLALHRPGYGYVGLRDPFKDDPHPSKDGLWTVDMRSGNGRLVISLNQLATLNQKPSMRNAFHYINHVQVSRTGRWVAFFHIWTTGDKRWEVRLYVCKSDGSQLKCLLDTGQVSHYDWFGDEAILVWAAHPKTGQSHFLHVTLDGRIRIFGEGILSEDGHCTFSPDRQWVLNDTYPDRFDMRTLMLARWPTGKRIDIGRLHSPKARWWGEIRCDLHPRWSRDGTKVCIDSVHDGSRQIYVIDVSRWVS